MKSKMIDDEDIVLGDNLEQLLWDINEFCSPNNQKQDEMPAALDNYLKYVAKTGNTVFPWNQVRPLFRMKMLAAINNFSGEPCNSESFVIERFDQFSAAPFTIQRFAELVTQPNRHYKMKEKFLRGLEKTVLVVSTIEPRSLTAGNGGGGGEEDSTEDTMSWMSQSENDNLPPDLPSDAASIPELNLNNVVEAVHPAALANVQTTVNNIIISSNSTEPQEQQPQQQQQEPQIKINSENVDEESEAGISDTPMPANIGSSPPLDYNVASQDNKVYSESSALKPTEDSSAPSNPDVVVDAPAAGSVETSSPDLVQSAENTVTTQGSAEESAGVEDEGEAVPEAESVMHTSTAESSSTSEEDVPMELESLPDNPPQIESSESSSSDSGGAIPDSPAEAPVEERIEPSIADEPEVTPTTTEPESSQGKEETEESSSSDPVVEAPAASESSSEPVVQPTSTEI